MQDEPPAIIPAWVTASTPRVEVVSGTGRDDMDRLAAAWKRSAGPGRDRVAVLRSRPASGSGPRRVLVVLDTAVVGWLPDHMTEAYVRVLAPLRRAGREVSVPVHAVRREGGSGGTALVGVSVDLPPPNLLVATNSRPKGQILDLPSGGPISLIRTAGRQVPLLGKPTTGASLLAHVTLRRAQSSGTDNLQSDVEVRLDGHTVGVLPPGDTAGYLELLSYAGTRGLTVSAHAVVVTGMSHQVELWAPRGHELAALAGSLRVPDQTVTQPPRPGPPPGRPKKPAAPSAPAAPPATTTPPTTPAPTPARPTAPAPTTPVPTPPRPPAPTAKPSPTPTATPSVTTPSTKGAVDPSLESTAIAAPITDEPRTSSTRRRRVRIRPSDQERPTEQTPQPEPAAGATHPVDYPPLGWYPDPLAQGRFRFWDGVTWTDHVMTDRPLDDGGGTA